MNARYYSPEFGRFISADVFISTGQGLQGANMFAYCGNNPVNKADDDGELASWVVGGIIGGAIGGVSTWLKGGSLSDIALGIGAGAVSGSLCAVGGGLLYLGAAISGVYKASTSEGSIGNRILKGVTTFGTTLIWGGFGSMSGATTNLEHFLIDTEFGLASEGLSFVTDQVIDAFFPSSASSELVIRMNQNTKNTSTSATSAHVNSRAENNPALYRRNTIRRGLI